MIQPYKSTLIAACRLHGQITERRMFAHLPTLGPWLEGLRPAEESLQKQFLEHLRQPVKQV